LSYGNTSVFLPDCHGYKYVVHHIARVQIQVKINGTSGHKKETLITETVLFNQLHSSRNWPFNTGIQALNAMLQEV
jgi:hypothetical protein